MPYQPWPASGAPEIEDESDATTTHRLARFDPLGGATPMRLRFGEGWRVEIDQEGAVRVERAS